MSQRIRNVFLRDSNGAEVGGMLRLGREYST